MGISHPNIFPGRIVTWNVTSGNCCGTIYGAQARNGVSELRMGLGGDAKKGIAGGVRGWQPSVFGEIGKIKKRNEG
jgi:hypothetical protein